MLRRAVRVVVIAAAVAGVSAVRPVSADPINILGGVIDYSRQSQAVIELALVDGWISGSFGDQVSESWTPSYACFSCVAGSTLDLSVSESMPQSDTVSAGGILMYRGVEYAISSLRFTIDSDPVQLPATFDVGDGLASSSIAQFVLHGLIQGRTADGMSAVGLTLLGYGKARLEFLSGGGWYDTRYLFQDPAAVPEPGTLLLFGTGIAAAVRGRRRR